MNNNFGGIGKKLRILCAGYGLEVEHVKRMAQDGHELFYYTPFFGAYPHLDQFTPGTGMDDLGVKKIKTFWNYVDKVDLIVFFDCMFGDWVTYLRKQGKVVFGSNMGGDNLELNRAYMRKLQGEIHLPVQKTDIVKGIPALRAFLKKNPEKYIKLDLWRGDVDSFYCKNYDLVAEYLDEIQVKWGPFADNFSFLVEDAIIDACEIGYDTFFNGKNWISPQLYGIEKGKSSYVGVYLDKYPEPLKKVQDALTPYLQKVDYRGALSCELRITKKGEPYFIDATMRYAFPLSILYTLSIENYSEVIYKVAKGEDVTIKNKGKYVSALPLTSDAGMEEYVLLQFPEKYAKYIKTRTSAVVAEKTYSIKGNSIIYLLVAAGPDYNKLIEFLVKLSDEVQAFKLNKDYITNLEKIKEDIVKLPQYQMGNFT